MSELELSGIKLRTAQLVLEVVVALTGVLIISVASYWLIWDRKPPVIYGEFLVQDITGRPTDKFRAGDTMVLTRYFCSHGGEMVVIDRRFISADGKASYSLSSSQTLLPDGCVRSTRAIPIPIYLPSGPGYKFEAIVGYTNNPLVSGTIIAPMPVIEIVR